MLDPASPYARLPDATETPVIRVTQAIAACNSLLKQLSFRVEGEVAGFNINKGQFVFFELKDEEAEARLGCFMMAHQLNIPLEDGMRVVVEARPGVHQKSGKFSLIVSRVEPKGEGSLKRAYDMLFAKLRDEGLFASDRKRLLPRFSRQVGIISSSEAAGFGDFRTIAFSRLPGVRFMLVDVAVQGRNAEAEICQAFDHLNGHYDLDCIVLIRGGGSLEDLHAFNSEAVARAVVRSKVPVLVGVGHERDVTIADYAADVRASTPSNAAQLLLPTRGEVEEMVLSLTQDGRRQVERTIQRQRERVASGAERRRQRLLLVLSERRTALQRRRERLSAGAELRGQRLLYFIRERQRVVRSQAEARTQTLTYVIREHRTKVQALFKTVEAISPRNTLSRGYSITSLWDGTVLSDATQVAVGQTLVTRLAKGTIESTVN